MRLLLTLLMAFAAASAHAMDYGLAPRQIAPDTWLLEGSTENFNTRNGGNVVNTAFIVTDAGVVVIDTGPSKRYGQAMRDAIARVTDQPIARVYLTHHHPDHVLGNQAFAEVPIAALAETNRLLAEQGDGMAENMYRVVGDWMRGTEVTLASETVEPGVVEIGGHRLHLLALRGHTGADLVIFDETTGVLFAGDILFHDRALTTPNSPGLEVWLGELDQLEALSWKVLVPGHGPIAEDAEPFAQMRDYLGWLDSLLSESAAQGLVMTEVMQAPVPERFAAISLTRYELIRTVTHLYPGYEAAQYRRVDHAQ